MGFDLGAGFEGEQAGSPMRSAASAWVSMAMGSAGAGRNAGSVERKCSEEDLRVGEGAARGGIGGDGADCSEGLVYRRCSSVCRRCSSV